MAGLEAGVKGRGIHLDLGTVVREIGVEGGSFCVEGGGSFVDSDVVGSSGFEYALIGVDSGGLDVGIEVALASNVGVEAGSLQIGVKTGVVVGIQVGVDLVDVVPPCPGIHESSSSESPGFTVVPAPSHHCLVYFLGPFRSAALGGALELPGKLVLTREGDDQLVFLDVDPLDLANWLCGLEGGDILDCPEGEEGLFGELSGIGDEISPLQEQKSIVGHDKGGLLLGQDRVGDLLAVQHLGVGFLANVGLELCGIEGGHLGNLVIIGAVVGGGAVEVEGGLGAGPAVEVDLGALHAELALGLD